MPKLTPHFVREGSEVLAFFEDRVIASGPNFSKVEETAVAYLEQLDKDRADGDTEKKKKSATHIVTPNGLKGEILSNVEGIWGEKEVTIRLENGRIAKFSAHGGNDDTLQYTAEKADAPKNALEYLESTINQVPEGNKESLSGRINDLDGLIAKASAMVQGGASLADQAKIDGYVIAARNEKLEVKEALDHLEQADAESFSPPPSFDDGRQVVEQADLGRGAGDSWLDHTVNDMITETEGQDFDKILAEEPGQFVTDLDTGALADAGVTREMAFSHIMAKTAGLQGDEIGSYREQFLAATELARRSELADRKETTHKEAAAAQEADDFPDEALFG